MNETWSFRLFRYRNWEVEIEKAIRVFIGHHGVPPNALHVYDVAQIGQRECARHLVEQRDLRASSAQLSGGAQCFVGRPRRHSVLAASPYHAMASLHDEPTRALFARRVPALR